MAKLKALPMEVINQLAAGLECSQPTADQDELLAHIKGSVPLLPPEDLHDVTELILALYRVREFTEASDEAFLGDLIQGIHGSSFADLEGIDQEESSSLRSHLGRLLGVSNLRIAAKAHRLQRAGERLYCDAKILSDIRPVFDEDVKTVPTGAVVGHTLRLGYHERGNHKDFFVVLDSADLEKLRTVIERAESKNKTLLKLLEGSGLKGLG